MITNDYFAFTVDGSDVANFALKGGVYSVALAGDSWGTVTLNLLAADGATYLPYQTWSSNAATTLTLAAGQYQFAYSSFTGTMGIAGQPITPQLESISIPLPITSSGGVTTVTTLGSDPELDLVSTGNSGGRTGSWLYTLNTTGDTSSSQAGVGTGNADAANSGQCYVYSGNTGAGTSGEIDIGTGNSSAGSSGPMAIYTGDGVGNTGLIGISTGASSGGDSGGIGLRTGNADGTRGGITLDAPTFTAPSGFILIAGAGGAITFTSGDSSADNGDGNSVDIASGNGGGTSGNGGRIHLLTGGAANGNSGDFYAASGTADNGNSGSAGIETGGATGTSGTAFLGTSDAAQAGDVTIYGGTSGGNGNQGGNIHFYSGAAAGTTAPAGDIVFHPSSGTSRNGLVILNDIPTADPHVAGALYSSAGTLKISAG